MQSKNLEYNKNQLNITNNKLDYIKKFINS